MRIAEVPSSPQVQAAPPDGGVAPAALRALAATGAEVRSSKLDRLLYSTDASIYQVEPLAVVIPRNIAQAVAVVQTCGEQGLPILPRGSGTALAGQSVNRAVVIDLSQWCRGIVSVDAGARRAVVESGVVLDQLNGALAQHGLMFGPDVATSSHATIGGMIGNNSAGAYSILYGHTVESVHAVEAALADGSVHRFCEGACDSNPVLKRIAFGLREIILPLASEIRSRFPKIRRHVDGYNLDLLLAQFEQCGPGSFDRVNLAKLICGSEGTLATTLRAELNLVPRPRHRGLAILGFASVEAALEQVTTLLGSAPAALELVDDVIIKVASANLEHRRYLEVMPIPDSGALGAVLYVEHFGDFPAEVAAKLETSVRLVPQAKCRLYTDPESMASAWKLRKAGEPLLHGIPGLRKPITFVEDAAVDAAVLKEFVREFRRLVDSNGTSAAYYAHASVGCLHIRPLICLRDPADRRRLLDIATGVADLVVQFGGALSGEHGDGRLRSPLLSRVLGNPICEALPKVKALFDPRGVMNPGNIVVTGKPAAILENLRVSPATAAQVDVPQGTPEVHVVVPRGTFFRYDREEGFEHAVEQCNGSGICRRLSAGGTMCPSYRVLLDEKHSTRGRANALRLALSGQLGGDGLNHSAANEALDLCLSCKACRAECPSNVDLAKLKAEYTAQGFAASGSIPLSTKLFGRVRVAMRWGSRLHPIANLLLQSWPGRTIAQSILGLASNRRVPLFARSLEALGAKRIRDRSAPVVILFVDCFTGFSETGIGIAAVELLERFGYRVQITDAGCCGRSLISTGMLAEACDVIRQTVCRLSRAVQESGAVAVLVCEPSCASAMRDEWTELHLGESEAAAHQLASMTFLVEEWLDARWDQHPTRPTVANGVSEQVLLHAHCHQRALWGENSSAGLLRRVFPSVRVTPGGCCGMAGSFGMRKDHIDLSLAIAQQSVLPAVQDRGEDVLCMSGSSCRQQVRDCTGDEALHPVQAVLKALG